jgi:CheY-like chemotaxis protein
VLVSVRDNGKGIAPEALDHVFEMFYQSGDPRQPQNTGLGIGLTLAKTLVEMHGGTVSVESGGVDRGCEFKVRLPISTAATAPGPRNARVATNGRRRVLVVDDNKDAADTLCMLLKTMGDNDVRTAPGGAEALEVAKEQRPEIVLIDLMMPGMDGYELAHRIRQAPWGKDAFLVALTGWGQDEHRRRTKEAGFDRHLVKPADPDALAAILAEPRKAALA